MTASVEVPSEYDDLPEPERTKAFEFLQELLASGAERAQALQEARERAQNWTTERARHSP